MPELDETLAFSAGSVIGAIQRSAERCFFLKAIFFVGQNFQPQSLKINKYAWLLVGQINTLKYWLLDGVKAMRNFTGMIPILVLTHTPPR